MTISSVIKFLEKNYPLKNAAKWDFPGLVLGNGRKKVQNILVALDLTTEVLEQAIDKKVNLIITHHPFIFNELSNNGLEDEFNKYNYKKNIYNRLQNLDIGLYTLHTQYDSSKNGTVDNVLEHLGFEGLKIANCSFGKKVNTPMNINALKNLITNKFQQNFFLTNKDEQFFSSCIGFLPGSGSIEDMIQAQKAGCGIIVTSDIKWSTWIWAEEENICLVEVSHNIENVFEKKLGIFLKEKFKEANVLTWKTKTIAKVY